MTFPTAVTGFPAPPARPDVPGFSVRALLGFGSHGEVWLADDVVTGEAVALKIGRPPGADPPVAARAAEARAALEREIALLSRVEDAHVVRFHRVVAMADGGHALVLEHAAGGNLGALVASRGALDPAEVTTVLVPLGQALERLHARGLVHGDLSPGNVLFAADGRPLLSDLGVAGVLGATGAGPHGTPGFVDPAVARGVDPRSSDVWGLAALGWFALTGRPPGEGAAVGARPPAALGAPGLTRLLAEVLGADPPERPSPGELAHRAWSAVPPAPVRLLRTRGTPDDPGPATRTTRRVAAAPPVPAAAPPGPRVVRRRRPPGGPPAPAPASAPASAPAVRPRSRSRRRQRSGLNAAAGLLVLVGLPAVGGAVWWANDADRVVVAQEVSVRTDAAVVAAAVAEIGRARARAFSTASAAELAAADEPGSPAMAADTAVVHGLAARGWRLAGVTYAVADLRVVHRDARTATVTARVTTSAHRRVTPGGALVAPVAAEGPRAVTLTLVSTRASGWRVRSVS